MLWIALDADGAVTATVRAYGDLSKEGYISADDLDPDTIRAIEQRQVTYTNGAWVPIVKDVEPPTDPDALVTLLEQALAIAKKRG